MTPLSRTAAAAVLGGMLLTPSSPAATPFAPTVPAIPSAPALPSVPVQVDDKEKAEAAAVKAQLEQTNTTLAAIQAQLKQITEALNGKKDEKGFTLPSDPGLLAQMKTLSDRLTAVEKDIASLRTQSASLRPANPVNPPPPSGTGSIPGATVDPKINKGTVRIVNEYPVRISIVVNGTSHRVEPSKSLDVDVTAGEFSYQLLESGAAPTKSVIKEKETVTLRIK